MTGHTHTALKVRAVKKGSEENKKRSRNEKGFGAVLGLSHFYVDRGAKVAGQLDK